MSKTPPRRNDRRRHRPAQTGPVDVWRAPRELPEVRPIEAAQNPAMLVASLGTPPLPGPADIGPYFQKVVDRAATIATALAFSVDLLAD